MQANELMEIIRGSKLSVDYLADKMGINSATFYRKLQNPTNSFSVEQASVLIRELKLSKADTNRIFFDL